LYQFTAALTLAGCAASSFPGNFWVIFNAVPGSSDVQVNGLPTPAAYYAYVTRGWDNAYFGTATSNGVKDTLGRVEGGKVTFTLDPQKAVVYLKSMALVDSARAWKSAKGSVDAIAGGASNGLPSGWPPMLPRKLPTSYNVPVILAQLQDPANKLCGQCMFYGSIGEALTRSLGIPDRLVTTVNSIVGVKGVAGAWTWNFHVWDEVWLNQVTMKDWSAYDPSSGNAFGHTPVTPVLPSPRTSAVFANRFAMGILPGSAAGVCPCRSTAFVTGALETRVDVTKAYRNPLPDPDFGPGDVSLAVGSSTYVFGDTVSVTLTVNNPYPFAIQPSANVTLAAQEFDGVNLEGPWPVATYNAALVIPPNGVATKTFDFTKDQYRLNGEYVALATVNLGPSNAAAYNFTDVSSGLSTVLNAPDEVPVGNEFTMNFQVTNTLSSPLTDTDVSIFLPDDVTTGSATAFTIATLDAGQTATFTLSATAIIPGSEVIETEASSSGAGVSNGYHFINLTESAVTMTESSSTISFTCSETTTSTTTTTTFSGGVPEFSFSAVVVAAAAFSAIAFLRMRNTSSRSEGRRIELL